MIIVRCKACNKEIKSSTQTQTCGCSNILTVTDDTFSARDMSMVVIVSNTNNNIKKEGLSDSDLAWQEKRRKRKVRKLDFEIK
mgnify:CR=1 FL=1|tara:strand:+ start:349 stop:597 length:249 start_codon:yes stop_codon:yes gene_type:complete